jgi:hypothetical protein
MKDAFDQWWDWANKPFSAMATIPAEIHEPVMALSPEDRHDREKVSGAAASMQAAPSLSAAKPRLATDKLLAD